MWDIPPSPRPIVGPVPELPPPGQEGVEGRERSWASESELHMELKRRFGRGEGGGGGECSVGVESEMGFGAGDVLAWTCPKRS